MSDLDYSKPPEQAVAELGTIKSQLNEKKKEIRLLQKAFELAINDSSMHGFNCSVANWDEMCPEHTDCKKCAMEFYMTKAEKLLEESR